MLWGDPCWGQTQPRNHRRPAVPGAALRKAGSQGNLPLLAPQVRAGNNGVLFGWLWPPWLLLLSHKRGRSLPSVQQELPDVYPGTMAMCWVRTAVSPAGGCGPSWLGGYLSRGAEEGVLSPVKQRGNSEMWVLASPHRVLAVWFEVHHFSLCLSFSTCEMKVVINYLLNVPLRLNSLCLQNAQRSWMEGGIKSLHALCS